MVDKVINKGYFIDVTIPGDFRVKTKTTEKLDKYRDLHMPFAVVPIIIRLHSIIS